MRKERKEETARVVIPGSIEKEKGNNVLSFAFLLSVAPETLLADYCHGEATKANERR